MKGTCTGRSLTEEEHVGEAQIPHQEVLRAERALEAWEVLVQRGAQVLDAREDPWRHTHGSLSNKAR